MGVAGDRREMMLAGRNERNRAQQDRLVIILGLAERALEQSGGIDRIARKPFTIGARDAGRGLAQPLARGIVAGRPDQGADRRLDLVPARARYMARLARRQLGDDLVATGLKIHVSLPASCQTAIGWPAAAR